MEALEAQQLAAVRTVRGPMIEPPHMWLSPNHPFVCTLTTNGRESGPACSPPMMALHNGAKRRKINSEMAENSFILGQ